MRARTFLVAFAALTTAMLPAAWSTAAELPHLTEYTMSIDLQDGAVMPTYTPPRSDLTVFPAVKKWDCGSKYLTDDRKQTATFTVTCLPRLAVTADADLPDVCRPGVAVHIISLVPGNNASGSATCGTSSAACTAYAVLPSPTFHGDCHLDAPAPVPGTAVVCAATWPLVQINTAWSVSCHDHA